MALNQTAFMLKIGLTLANSDRTACTTCSQTILMAGVLLTKHVFTENTAHSTVWSSGDVIFTQCQKQEESIKMPKVHNLTAFLPIYCFFKIFKCDI